ncbi:MAG: hypothetical protein GSR72_00145 [Desulfurococcales archaeon]|nr:hypothetical protein [Desulfurococcales archaeon]
MRALTIAMFIFIVSLSMSAVREAYGLSASGPLWQVSEEEIKQTGSVEEVEGLYSYSMVGILINSVKALFKVIAGAALIGETLQAFIPYPLPSTLLVGLDALGTTSILIAVAQFLRGIGTRGMD